MQESWILSLGQEDILEKGMATHSSILAWKIPGTEEPDKLQSTESQSQTQLNDKHAEVTEKGYQKELKHRTTTIRKTVFKNNKLY